MRRIPRLTILMLATGVSPIADAVGLGDIHIDSALNEPLTAQIDIFGANQDDLATMAAKVANRDVFEQHGDARPTFLSSTQFRVGVNAQGRPVLNVHSTEAFNEPVVTLFVDFRWNNTHLVKEYSLLLDPAVYLAEPSAPPHDPNVVTEASTDYTPLATGPSPSTVPSSNPVAHTILAHGSLRSIARRAGAHTKSQISKMMVALYAANPLAFDGNMYKIHREALLTVPTLSEVATIKLGFARRQIRADRRAWLQEKSTSAIVANAPQSDSTSVLKNRVQSLERGLKDLHQQLASDDQQISALSRLATLRATVRPASAPLPAPSAPPAPAAISKVQAAVVPTPFNDSNKIMGWVFAGFAFLFTTFFWYRKRLPNSGLNQREQAIGITETIPTVAMLSAQIPIIAPPVQSVVAPHVTPTAMKETLENSTRDQPMLDTATYNMVGIEEMDIDTALLKNELNTVIMENKSQDLDPALSGNNTASHHYVDMPSNLHDRVILTERRSDIVDILKSAIERDPKRQDLQLKLLETYYSLVTANHRAFMEVARTLARDRELIKVADWEKILMMGREIASDDVLFEHETVSSNLVNCA